jgi:hypothetical protein
LGLTAAESKDLVDFMRNALTDQRVACESAPFDHPSLKLHDGHKGDEHSVLDRNEDGFADDKFEVLPAVGRNGLKKENCLSNDDGSILASLRTIPPTGTGGTTPPTGTGGTTPPTGTGGTTPPTGTGGTTPPAGTGGTTPPTGTGGTTPPAGTGGTTPPTGTGGTTPPTGTGGTTPPTGTGGTTPPTGTGGRSSNRFAGNLNFGESKSGSSKFGSDGIESKFGESKEEAKELQEVTSNNDSQPRIQEIEQESNRAAPGATVNVPETVLARSRVTMYGSVTTGATYAWTQIEGPQVTLSNADSLKPSFTAPAVAAQLVFELSASDSSGISTTTLGAINVVTDEVTIHSVSWTGAQASSKTKGKAKVNANGKLTVVASSSAIADDSLSPVGMSMTAVFWSKAIPAGQPGSATQPFEAPMTLVKNQPGKPAVCATAIPCFSVDLSEGIVDAKDPLKTQIPPLFVPPTSVVVKSFLGGVKTAKEGMIHIR